jgi:hypothetical protein
VRRDAPTYQRYFLWEGDNLLAELTGTASAVLGEYGYYPGLDNPHAFIRNGTPYFAHRDAVGNVIALTTEAQEVAREYACDAWGAGVGGTDHAAFNGADRARWKGALWTGPEVELYYPRNRWHEPLSGRFLSEDGAPRRVR